jgi:hypothetical protein
MKRNEQVYFINRKPPGPISLNVGDRVSYTRYFLKVIGIPATHEMWCRRGIVVEIKDWCVYVLWEGEKEPIGVRSDNLAIPGPNLRFCE